MTSPATNLIILDYNDLLQPPTEAAPKLSPLLEQAFGTSSSATSCPSLGLLAIRNIPNFESYKQATLSLAHELARLPPDYLEGTLSDPHSLYNAGWSHGKEQLKPDTPDRSKASFYFNPVTDVPGTPEDRKLYPASYPLNRWPEEKLPPLEIECKKLGCLMKQVVALLAHHIDFMVGKDSCASMGPELSNTEKVKGRLLYYFPLETESSSSTTSRTSTLSHCGEKDNESTNSNEVVQDSWIGWHNDSGFLTALAGDMYIDHETGQEIPKEEIDPHAGLYIMDRTGTVTKVDIPDDCMAVQIGECLQIVTGGRVVATPHCVRIVLYKVFLRLLLIISDSLCSVGRFEEPIPIMNTKKPLRTSNARWQGLVFPASSILCHLFH